MGHAEVAEQGEQHGADHVERRADGGDDQHNHHDQDRQEEDLTRQAGEERAPEAVGDRVADRLQMAAEEVDGHRTQKSEQGVHGDRLEQRAQTASEVAEAEGSRPLDRYAGRSRPDEHGHRLFQPAELAGDGPLVVNRRVDPNNITLDPAARRDEQRTIGHQHVGGDRARDDPIGLDQDEHLIQAGALRQTVLLGVEHDPDPPVQVAVQYVDQLARQADPLQRTAQIVGLRQLHHETAHHRLADRLAHRRADLLGDFPSRSARGRLVGHVRRCRRGDRLVRGAGEMRPQRPGDRVGDRLIGDELGFAERRPGGSRPPVGQAVQQLAPRRRQLAPLGVAAHLDSPYVGDAVVQPHLQRAAAGQLKLERRTVAVEGDRRLQDLAGRLLPGHDRRGSEYGKDEHGVQHALTHWRVSSRLSCRRCGTTSRAPDRISMS